jgi:hypothetical protein
MCFTMILKGKYQVIILPDVYEHIPKMHRETLHAKLSNLLSEDGKIVITIPSPGNQHSLYEKGPGLQIVDKIVTLEDLVKLANDVGGTLTYFNTISVWETNDYIHAMIEKDVSRLGP